VVTLGSLQEAAAALSLNRLGFCDQKNVRNVLNRSKEQQRKPGRVENVQVLGTDEKLKWNQSGEGLRVELPKRYRPTNYYATSLKISLA
jgi:hypothetical protein